MGETLCAERYAAMKCWVCVWSTVKLRAVNGRHGRSGYNGDGLPLIHKVAERPAATIDWLDPICTHGPDDRANALGMTPR